MNLTSEILTGLGHAAAYVAVATLVLVAGYVVTDLLTPGKLTTRILTDRDPNITVIAATNLAAAGMVVFSAIYGTRDDFGAGLVGTAVFGLVGVLMLALVDLVIDVLTPGKLHDVLCGPAQPVARVSTSEDAEGLRADGEITKSFLDNQAASSSYADRDHQHVGRLHPGVWFVGTAHLVVGAIVAVSIA